jgi:hypothetical protein
VLVLPLAVLGTLRLADRGSRLVGAAVVLTGYAAVVATGSRAALLAAALGAAVLVLARCGTAGLLGLAVICLVDHPTNSLRVASAVWVVLGLLATRAGATIRRASGCGGRSARRRRPRTSAGSDR